MGVYEEMWKNILNDPVPAFFLLWMIFNSFLIIIFIVYVKKYIKKNQNDFLKLYYGSVDVLPSLKSNLDVTTFLFHCVYLAQLILVKIFGERFRVLFPSKNQNKYKPFGLTPNAYIENIEIFKKKHGRWIYVSVAIDAFIISTSAVCFTYLHFRFG